MTQATSTGTRVTDAGDLGRDNSPMNPLLGKLHPYPFESWRELTRGITPNPALRSISLGIGEPRHAAPELV